MKKIVFLPDTRYNNKIIGLMKKLKDEKLCYVSLNKTYRSLLQDFSKNGIATKNIFFIDSISPSIFKLKNEEKCTFLEPTDLNKFSNVLLNTIKLNKVKTVIFDSVSSMLIYKKEEEVIKFFDYILSFIEEMEVDIILMCLYEDNGKPPVKQLKMRVDKIEEIEGDL